MSFIADDCEYDTKAEYLFIGVLGGCACGNGDEIAEDVLELFMRIGRQEDGRNRHVYADKYHSLIAHWLDAAGLTEHGTGIGTSWLTDKGKEIFERLL